MCSRMGSITLASILLMRFCGSIPAPHTHQTHAWCFSIPSHGRWHTSGPNFTQTLQRALSGFIPIPLLWFPSVPFFGGNLSLSNEWRLPFPVFKHGYADNCILISFPVIFICLWQKVPASAQLLILTVNHQFL